MVEIRTAYKQYGRVQVDFPGPSMTKQYFKEESDINAIIAKHPDVSQIPYVNNVSPSYGDFTDVSDYRDAIDRVSEAQDSFDALPSDIRSRFNNDPGEFLSFVLDPNNVDEMVKMGIAQAEPVESAVNESTPAQAVDSA